MDTEKVIQKWLTGELSEEERQAFDALEKAPVYRQIVEDASHFKASHFSKMPDFETFKANKMAVKATDPKVRKLNWKTPVLRIASVVVVAFGLLYYYTLNQLTQVETRVAQKTTLELPDASRVVLNAQSEVNFKERNWENNREINLEGEAFFDVAKGSRFDVITPQGTVSVLGTEFNVKQRGDFFEVACYEGTVQVVTGDYTEILKAGDNFRFAGGKGVRGNQSSAVPEWTENRSYFQRTPLKEVLNELERQFNVSLIREGIDSEELFTGGFDHDNLEGALQAVAAPMNLDYTILNDRSVRLNMRD